MTATASAHLLHSDSQAPPWLSVADVLAVLAIERSTWEKWRQRGLAPPAVRLPNGQLRIRRDWFDDWLERLPASP